MALELRWAVEQRVLIPSLNGTQGVLHGGPDEAEREVEALRRLTALARDKDLGIEVEQPFMHDVVDAAIATLATKGVCTSSAGNTAP